MHRSPPGTSARVPLCALLLLSACAVGPDDGSVPAPVVATPPVEAERAPDPFAYPWPEIRSEDGKWAAQLTAILRQPGEHPGDPDLLQVQLELPEDDPDVLLASGVAPGAAPLLELTADDGARSAAGPGPGVNVDSAWRQIVFFAVPVSRRAFALRELVVRCGVVRVTAWDTHTLTLAGVGETADTGAGPFRLSARAEAGTVSVSASSAPRAPDRSSPEDPLDLLLTHRWAARAVRVVDAGGRVLPSAGGAGSGGATVTRFRDLSADAAPIAFPVTVSLRVPSRYRVEPVTFRWAGLDLPLPRDDAGAEIPRHLSHFGGLHAREGDRVVDAPAADVEVARSYPWRAAKGPLSPTGERLTLLSAKSVYARDEEIRVIHVYEATAPGVEVYMMGPQAIFGETVDGADTTPAAPEGYELDGLVVPGPAANWNFEVTSYRPAPGRHVIRWSWQPPLGGSVLTSNELVVEVR